MNKFQKEKFTAAITAFPYLTKLNKKLLSLGGDTVVLWNPDVTTQESFVEILLMFGRVTKGALARFKEMTRNNCHENSKRLAVRYPKRYQAETGYALSDDGCWRPHGWSWDIKESRVVETTVPRELYFGFTENI